jgi:hypothetical protein
MQSGVIQQLHWQLWRLTSLIVDDADCSAQPINGTPAYRSDLLVYSNVFLDGECDFV